jgi:ferredoxin
MLCKVPVWIPDKCTQCNYCAIVCPHGVIRPFLFDKEGQVNKPDGMVMKKAQGGAELGGLQYSINLATMDCTGCAVCVESCPDDALVMTDFTAVAHDEVEHRTCIWIILHAYHLPWRMTRCPPLLGGCHLPPTGRHLPACAPPYR